MLEHQDGKSPNLPRRARFVCDFEEVRAKTAIVSFMPEQLREYDAPRARRRSRFSKDRGACFREARAGTFQDCSLFKNKRPGKERATVRSRLGIHIKRDLTGWLPRSWYYLAHLPRPGLPPQDFVPAGLTRYVLPPPVGLPPYDFVPVGLGYGVFGECFLPPPSFFLPLPFVFG